jgi:DNA-binding GntR family transcriptional regulator
LMIALPATASLIEQLSELQRQYCARADAQDLRGIHEANDAFHVALFSACGNPYLVRSLQDYMNLTLPMRAKNLADKEGLALSRRQHELMIELLRGRDSFASITCNTASRIISAASRRRSRWIRSCHSGMLRRTRPGMMQRRHFQSTILLASPSNSMLQNAPP